MGNCAYWWYEIIIAMILRITFTRSVVLGWALFLLLVLFSDTVQGLLKANKLRRVFPKLLIVLLKQIPNGLI